MWVQVLRFCRDRRGVTSIEYAWICLFISLVIVAAAHYMGSWVYNVYNEMANGLSSA